MKAQDQHSIVVECMPFKSGLMSMTGARTSDLGATTITRYDTRTVPYIIYQEEGFQHWLSGEMVTVNQYFIRQTTIGALTQAQMFGGQQASEYMTNVNDAVRKRSLKSMMSAGVVKQLKMGR